ncbi:MAG: hypothetical protein NTX00_01315 [Candidatus Parcubacteria bacterium]|nr:hypothetical protein [Candidatus Parcubacteria bacterium]
MGSTKHLTCEAMDLLTKEERDQLDEKDLQRLREYYSKLEDEGKITRDQLRNWMFLPMTKEEVEQLREIRKQDSWLFALNFSEMERRESDPNYGHADDPTCVLVEFEGDVE